jgi:putative PIN family toxin of toxin-antitoxin system
MTQERPRVIFDCNVLLQGILNRDGPSGACLQLVKSHRITLLLSLETLSEARDVLKRPVVQRIAPHLTSERIHQILTELTYIANLVRDVQAAFAFPRDPKDQPYLNLAITGESQFLVTRDKDLLDLMSNHSAEAKQFRQLTKNRLRIVEPTEFLNTVRAEGRS